MADRIAEQGALQDAISNNEINPPRLSLAGYIRGLFLDWSASPYNPLTRLTAKGRYLGYFWDNGAIGLSMDFANQSFIVKDGTLQSKSFSDIVNFSRTSNATVTRADGTIGYAPHNLLTFSEQFDNAAWVKARTTISANAITAPDGTLTADAVYETADTGTHLLLQNGTTAGQAFTVSFYVKGGLGRNWIWLRNIINAGGGAPGVGSAYFDITNGVVGTVSAGVTATIIPLSNGWYKCSSTTANTATSTQGWGIGIASADNVDSYTGDITKGIYVWGAQLEIGSTATTYNPTTVKNLLGYSELFDNAAWTKSNSFVQTNLLTYSEAFDNAAWVKTNVSVTANSLNAPNGYQTAELMFLIQPMQTIALRKHFLMYLELYTRIVFM